MCVCEALKRLHRTNQIINMKIIAVLNIVAMLLISTDKIKLVCNYPLVLLQNLFSLASLDNGSASLSDFSFQKLMIQHSISFSVDYSIYGRNI